MRIFIDERGTPPTTDWDIIGAGVTFVPRNGLQLLVRGFVYNIKGEYDGIPLTVTLYDGTKVEATYLR